MAQVKVGDRVRLTIEGIVGDRKEDAANCHRIRTDSGFVHFAYIGYDGRLTEAGTERYGVKVDVLEPEPVAGQAYIDADDEILIRTRDKGWRDGDGDRYSDDYATRPLRLLVPREG